MKIPRSIRWRIQLWHGALLSAVIIGFCFVTYGLQKKNLYRMADEQLSMRLDSLTGVLGTQGPPGGAGPDFVQREQQRDRAATDGRPPGPPEESLPPLPPDAPNAFQIPPTRKQDPLRSLRSSGGNGLFSSEDPAPFYFCLWTRFGDKLDQSGYLPDGVERPQKKGGPGLERSAQNRGKFREYYVFTPPGECILVGRSMEPVQAELHKVVSHLALAGAGLLALGLAGGWWVASVAIRPIKAISAAAARISAGNLAERISLDDTRSELGQLANVLNDAFQRLDAAFAQQARFTSDAAHELRTPVAVVLGQTQLALAKPRSPEEYRETLEACQRAAKRMHGLIESLLELSVLDASGTKLKRQRCDLAEIGRENLEMVRLLADERQIVLEGRLAPALCSADSERISQILVNLLSNAMKFSGAGSTVRLETARDNGCAVIRVADTGPGIPDEHLAHLFDRFYRVDKSRNRASGGAGLGLAISKSIAEAHGGVISVESSVGKGTTFTLRIPAA